MPPRPCEHAADIPAALPVHACSGGAPGSVPDQSAGHSSCMQSWLRGGCGTPFALCLVRQWIHVLRQLCDGVGDGWPPSTGRLVLVWLLMFVPEFCVPPLVLLWPKIDSPGASLSFSFLVSVSGSQFFSQVPTPTLSTAFDGRPAGENNLKDVLFVPAAPSLLVFGLCETDSKDMVSEAFFGAGRCEADPEEMVSEASGTVLRGRIQGYCV